jgi:hypothetical protein
MSEKGSTEQEQWQAFIDSGLFDSIEAGKPETGQLVITRQNDTLHKIIGVYGEEVEVERRDEKGETVHRRLDTNDIRPVEATSKALLTFFGREDLSIEMRPKGKDSMERILRRKSHSN